MGFVVCKDRKKKKHGKRVRDSEIPYNASLAARTRMLGGQLPIGYKKSPKSW
jgi:hypothetical protein